MDVIYWNKIRVQIYLKKPRKTIFHWMEMILKKNKQRIMEFFA